MNTGQSNFAYANTLPNTHTAFPPSANASRNDAPWATNYGFALPPSVQDCGRDSVSISANVNRRDSVNGHGVNRSTDANDCRTLPDGTTCCLLGNRISVCCKGQNDQVWTCSDVQ